MERIQAQPSRSSSLDSDNSANNEIRNNYCREEPSPSYYSQSVAPKSTKKLLKQLLIMILLFDLYYGIFYIFLYRTHPSAVFIHKLDRVARILLGIAGIFGIYGYRKCEESDKIFKIYLKIKIGFAVVLPLLSIFCKIYD